MSLTRTTSVKLLASLSVIGSAAAVAGLGTFGTFDSTTSASQTVASGTVTVALGSTGASTNRLTVNASGLVPGDTVQRSFDLSNTGNQDFASVTLTTTATSSSLLDTDPSGLTMVVDRCSNAWTEAGGSPAFSYTCSGSTSTVIASRAVIGSAIAMSNLSSLTHGTTDHLRVTLTLPSGAGNTLQNQSSTIQYAFTATQRAGTNQ